MRVLFVGINAKYIHTNPAIRILKRVSESVADTAFMEFTIHDANEIIIEKMHVDRYDMIGFSCYIWNIVKMREIATLIKQKYPNIVLFAGGPEVSYSNNKEPFDYIIRGDGEHQICDFLTKQSVHSLPTYANHFNQIPFIGDLYSEEDFQHKIIYMETTRGCPFHCSYCLASIQGDKVIFKSEKSLFDELDYLIQHQAKTIKFLDRSFNVDGPRFLRILQYVEQLNTKQVFQFEIAADLLNENVMDYLINKARKNQIRLEIGIQSVHDKTNAAVDRISNIPQVLEKIRRLMDGGRVTIHADLIAGLPYEDYLLFQQSFNTVFALFPHELQLGFLKMLPGTKLAQQSALFHYDVMNVPPYEIRSNPWLKPSELLRIHWAEIALEALWNKPRLTTTIQRLINDCHINAYEFMETIGNQFVMNQVKKEIDYYTHVLAYCQQNHYEVEDYIKLDYLKRNRIRITRFWGRENESFSLMKSKLIAMNLFDQRVLDSAFITKTSQGYIVVTRQVEHKIYCVEKGLLVEIQ